MKSLRFLLAVPLLMLVFVSYACKEKPEEEPVEVEVKKEAPEAKPTVEPVEKPKKAKKSRPSIKININTATAEELTRLPGIREKLAKRIVVYREEHGNFEKIEDIKNVKGKWDRKYNKVKNYITVGEAPSPQATSTPTSAPTTPTPTSTATPETTEEPEELEETPMLE